MVSASQLCNYHIALGSWGSSLFSHEAQICYMLEEEVSFLLQCMSELFILSVAPVCSDPPHCLVSAPLTLWPACCRSCVPYALPAAALVYSMHYLLQLLYTLCIASCSSYVLYALLQLLCALTPPLLLCFCLPYFVS